MRPALLGLSLAAVSIVAVVYYRNRNSGASADALDEVVVSAAKLGDGKAYADDTLSPLEQVFVTAKKIAASVVSSAKTGSTSGARGLRNNNPGNIRHSSTKWQGQSPTQTDSAFVQFTEPKWGVRALSKVLQTYRNKYGLQTVRDLINRWAPPVENNTDSYVAQVARAINVTPDSNIDVSANLPGLTAAIIKHENGSNPYTSAQIKEWVYLP